MQAGHYLYLPVTPVFFLILVGAFVALVLIIQFRLLRYAYMQLGVSSGTALLLLFGSLIGSYFNIPVVEIPNQQVVSGQEVEFYGMHYQAPVVTDSSTTIVALNVGGAVIPILMSFFLLTRHGLWIKAGAATIVVAAVCYFVASPIPGIGIAVPVFIPVIVTTVVAVIIDRDHAAPLAYIAGSLGTLIGADLMNLNKVVGLGAPVLSIGGAGTFDGIFMTSILAVLLASIRTRSAEKPA
jgi:uncharacterized membrane protein